MADEDQTGETMSFDDEPDDVQDTPDGGAIVKIDDSPKKGESEFFATWPTIWTTASSTSSAPRRI